MNLRILTRQEILKELSSGKEVVIDASREPAMSKALSFYIEQLEIRYTYWSIVSGYHSDCSLLMNVSNMFRLYTRYPFLLKLGHSWRRLKWITVETDTMPPCSIYKLKFVGSKENMPTNVYGA